MSVSKNRPINYRGYQIAKHEKGGFVISRDGKPVVSQPSMQFAYRWIDREENMKHVEQNR